MLDLFAEGAKVHLTARPKPAQSCSVESPPNLRQKLACSKLDKTRFSSNPPFPPPSSQKVLELSIAAFRRDGIELTGEDLAFIRHRLALTPNKRDAQLAEYRERWRTAMEQELAPHKKQNRGRFAANSFLRTIHR